MLSLKIEICTLPAGFNTSVPKVLEASGNIKCIRNIDVFMLMISDFNFQTRRSLNYLNLMHYVRSCYPKLKNNLTFCQNFAKATENVLLKVCVS